MQFEFVCSFGRANGICFLVCIFFRLRLFGFMCEFTEIAIALFYAYVCFKVISKYNNKIHTITDYT